MRSRLLQKFFNFKVTLVLLVLINFLLIVVGGCYYKYYLHLENIDLLVSEVSIDKENLLTLYEQFIEDYKLSIVDNVSTENERNSIEYLTETIGVRVTGYDNEKEAALWLQERLDEFGYQTELQNFVLSNGLSSQNVIAFTEDDLTVNGKTIIIGAHYDSVVSSPGAMDNGSGVVAVLEIARVMSTIDLKFNLIFIFFGGEECIDSLCSNYQQGAKYYVSELDLQEKEVFYGMINLDMVAEDGEIQLRRDASLVNANSLAGEIDVSFDKVDVDATIVQSQNWSDHEPFEEAGVPSVFVFTYKEEYDYLHTSRDSIDKINFYMLEDITRGVVMFILDRGLSG